jgi:hypothetical protein
MQQKKCLPLQEAFIIKSTISHQLKVITPYILLEIAKVFYIFLSKCRIHKNFLVVYILQKPLLRGFLTSCVVQQESLRSHKKLDFKVVSFSLDIGY